MAHISDNEKRERKKNMLMKFIKMNGAGNDYVYVDCTKEKLPKASDHHMDVIPHAGAVMSVVVVAKHP